MQKQVPAAEEPALAEAMLSGSVLSGLLPRKPRTPREPSRPRPNTDGRWPPSRPSTTRPGTRESARAALSESRPSTAQPPPLFGAEALPSERVAARHLQASLLRAFERAPAARHDAASLLSEWELLSMCSKQLVKQLATRCLEWGDVLEAIRSRLDGLWADAADSLRRHEAAGPGGAELLAQLAALSEQNVAAEARARAAEERTAELAELPAQVASLTAELEAARAVIAEQRERDRAERNRDMSYTEAMALAEEQRERAAALEAEAAAEAAADAECAHAVAAAEAAAQLAGLLAASESPEGIAYPKPPEPSSAAAAGDGAEATDATLEAVRLKFASGQILDSARGRALLDSSGSAKWAHDRGHVLGRPRLRRCELR